MVVGFFALIFEKGPCCGKLCPNVDAAVGCTQHHLDEPTILHPIHRA